MTISQTSDYKYNRSASHAIANGIKCKCPNCGTGSVFEGFVSVKDHCEDCNEELFHHRADDLPPYLNILLVGHVVVGFLMVCMKYELFGMWTTAIGGSLLAIAMAVALMRPLKGAVIGLQWALEMHGFGEDKHS